jgi:hypothetical protein
MGWGTARAHRCQAGQRESSTQTLPTRLRQGRKTGRSSPICFPANIFRTSASDAAATASSFAHLPEIATPKSYPSEQQLARSILLIPSRAMLPDQLRAATLLSE